MFTCRITFLLFLLIPLKILSQVDTSKTAEDLIQTYLEESTENDENSALFDLLENLRNDPVSINSANIDKLLTIPFLDIEAANAILNYRKKNSTFFSTNELNLITELDDETIIKIKPFITLKEKQEDLLPQESKSFTNIFGLDFRSRFLYDLQDRSGFTNGIYQGSRYKTYNRLKANYGKNYRLAILAEKDAGESSFTDHYTFFIEGRDIDFENHILFGDYSFEFGQGLVLWSPYAFSKGSDAINPVVRRDRNIIGFSSADENRFFRGASGSLNYGDFRFVAFYSNKDIDANLSDSLFLITSLPEDGNHRNENELNKRKKVNEKAFGGRIDYSYDNTISLGVLAYNSKYSNEFEKSSVYDFGGSTFNYYSISYKLYLPEILISGETAYNGTSVATINTIQLIINKKFALTSSIRNYPRNFTTLHANGFGERANTINEFGIYTGFRWRTDVGTINFYFDQFQFPYAISTNPLPSTGNEWLVNYTVTPVRKFNLSFRYKNEKKEELEKLTEESVIAERLKQNIRVELNYQPSDLVRLRTRVEYIHLLKKGVDQKENGFLVYQDIRYKPISDLNLYGRLVFFHTDSYDSRLYQFENDLTGIMNNPALFGKGIRLYFLARYKILDELNISLKYAETYKPDEDFLSSGYQEITGNIDNRISFQLDVRF